ncbi:MAG: CBS domain-containing protein [Thermoplasmata archaeon]|nr:MAG: CBS domain-containing protein [Thermoplasmata archaeon]HDN96155.1 CBS domain-containing protein [Thermoplasmatales archaeon]
MKLKVKDVMDKNPIVAEVPGSREDVLRIFAKYEVSGVPVVKAGTKKLVGVVTRNDLFRRAEEEQLALIMNDNPITISPEADLKKAAKIFYEKRIHGIPVVRRGELVGVISPTDILKVIAEKGEDEVEKYLSPIFIPIYQETPLPVVMKIFRLTDASALPVLDDEGNLAGIVADGDLFTFSHLQEGIAKSDIGLGEDEDLWTWEGIRDVMRLYYETSKIQLPSVPVKEVMVRDVITTYKKAKIKDVAKKMLENDVNQLPVLDERDDIIGMVYDIDLMRALL